MTSVTKAFKMIEFLKVRRLSPMRYKKLVLQTSVYGHSSFVIDSEA